MPRAGNVTPMEIEDGDLGTVSGNATYNLTNFDDLGGGDNLRHFNHFARFIVT